MLKEVVGKGSLNQDDRSKGSLVDQIKSAAMRHGVELPDGWKPEVARRIVVAWSTTWAEGYAGRDSGPDRGVVQRVDEPFSRI